MIIKPKTYSLYYFFILISTLPIISSCQKPLSHYKITCERYSRNVINGRLEADNEIKYITATDDTSAYRKGLIDYYANLDAERLVPSSHYQTTSFMVTDTTGVNIVERLPPKTIDSLTVIIKDIAADRFKIR